MAARPFGQLKWSGVVKGAAGMDSHELRGVRHPLTNRLPAITGQPQDWNSAASEL
jgi:hypothetical protein